MIFIQYVLPYLAALITALISGLVTYFSAIKKCALDNEIKIKSIREQCKLDLEKQKELFKLEIDKINLQHQNELEKLKVESNNQLTNSLSEGIVSILFSNPQKLKDLIDFTDKLNNKK